MHNIDEQKITRGCLWDLRSSELKMYLPADTFTGCRKGSDLYERVLTGNHHTSSHDSYSETKSAYRYRLEYMEICFCDDWNTCNKDTRVKVSTVVMTMMLLVAAFLS